MARPPGPLRPQPPGWPGQPFQRTSCQVLLSLMLKSFDPGLTFWSKLERITPSFGNAPLPQFCRTSQGLSSSFVTVICRNASNICCSTTTSISLPLWWNSQHFFGTLWFPSCSAGHNSPSLCNVSICRDNTKAPDCQWSDFSKFSDLSQRCGGRERVRGARINRKMHSVISQHARFYTLFKLAPCYLCLLHPIMTLLDTVMWNMTCDTGAYCLKHSMTYGGASSHMVRTTSKYLALCMLTRLLIGSLRNIWIRWALVDSGKSRDLEASGLTWYYPCIFITNFSKILQNLDISWSWSCLITVGWMKDIQSACVCVPEWIETKL